MAFIKGARIRKCAQNPIATAVTVVPAFVKRTLRPSKSQYTTTVSSDHSNSEEFVIWMSTVLVEPSAAKPKPANVQMLMYSLRTEAAAWITPLK
jgi:hypothetical protein